MSTNHVQYPQAVLAHRSASEKLELLLRTNPGMLLTIRRDVVSPYPGAEEVEAFRITILAPHEHVNPLTDQPGLEYKPAASARSFSGITHAVDCLLYEVYRAQEPKKDPSP